MSYTGMIPDGGVVSFTPTVGVANWVLETIASRMAKVCEVGWGGEAASTTPMRTRVSRDSAVGTGARTAQTVGKTRPNVEAANAAFLSSTYASSQPTIAVAVLVGKSWNAYGGLFAQFFGPGEELIIIGAASLECRADLGVGLSSYDTKWNEE